MDAAERLRAAGLRPTRQRIELVGLLFAAGHRHMTAESLHGEAQTAGVQVSLATVYNTLHQFTAVGLLREVVVDASRSYFDTNTGDHQHFFVESDGELIDIPGEDIAVAGVPEPPNGLTIDRIDVVVRVRRG
ncbi:MAG TPA: Fur family transcriptional regulator [Rhizomicrobium sp.]